VQVGNPWDYSSSGANFDRTNYSSLLSVNCLIVAKLVKVTTTNWADHVFSPDYWLRPLQEVEKFVQRNGHLPGVPSEKEVRRDGIDVAAMQAKAMEKIEELTLYMIDLEKKNKELQQRLEELERKKP